MMVENPQKAAVQMDSGGQKERAYARVCATVVPDIGLEICQNLEERIFYRKDQIRWYRRNADQASVLKPSAFWADVFLLKWGDSVKRITREWKMRKRDEAIKYD